MLAQDLVLTTPKQTLQSYHKAINEGDIQTLKAVCVPETFDIDMQTYALSMALKDKKFHQILKDYPKNAKAREIVQGVVALKLKHRKKRDISDLKEISLGKDRVMIRFLEAGKPKQLYLSLEGKMWKINYLAGRKR